MKEKLKQSKGITLVALVITIIVLLILAAVSINLVLGENGILQRAQSGAKEYNIKAAQEAMEMKIAAADMKYGGRATLQQLADELCEDEEVEYVHAKSQVASLEHITLSSTDNLATKLKAFPYEFEINAELSIAKVDGVVLTSSNTQTTTLYDANIYDEWRTWLHLAGIEDPTIYNGQKILNNTELMKKVSQSEAAIDYMSKSTSFILPMVINSEIATNEILTKKETYSQLFKDEDLYKQIVETPGFISKLDSIATTIPVQTDNSNTRALYAGINEDYTDQWGTCKRYYPFDNNNSTWTTTTQLHTNAIGSYIGYDFENPVYIYKATGKIRMKGYSIDYSDDNVNWTSAYSGTLPCSNSGDEFSNIISNYTGAHRYWRISVTGGQQASNWSACYYSMQLYGIPEANS